MNKSLLESLQNLQLANPFSALELPFMLIAFCLCVVGFIFNVLHARDDPLRAFTRVGIASIFIAAMPLWTGLVRDAVYFLPYSLLDYHTSLMAIFKSITNAVNSAARHDALDFSIFDALGSVLMDFVVTLLMRMVAGIGSILAIPLLFVQIGVEKFLVVAMPVAIAMLTVPALRNQAQGFIAFWFSVLLWPLFFAVVTVVASLVFSVSNHLGTTWAETNITGGIFANFLAPFCAGAILIGGVLATPPLAFSLATHGGAALTGPSPSLITFLR